MRRSEAEQHLHQVLQTYSQYFTKPDESWPVDIHCALNYLNNNLFKTSCSVRNMNSACNQKQRNFSTRFRNYVGVPPVRYINKHRLAASKLLLSDTRLSELFISEIGFFVGFEKPSSFSMLYVKNEQVSPKKWRKLNRKIEE